MPTLNEAIGAIKRHVGFPESRSRVVARRLREAGHLPAGAPGLAPEVDVQNVLDLIVALASDARIHRVADALENYNALVPGGADLSTAPPAVATTAGKHLLAIARLAADGDQDVRRLRIEVVSTWLEVACHWPDGSVHRFRELGALASHWDSTGHRRSTTIPVAAMADTLNQLFKDH